MRLSCVEQWFAGGMESMTQEAIRLGSRVRVQDADGDAEFSIVPPEEADCMADRISMDSPLGRALLGRRLGERVRFRAPGSVLVVTIVGICS
jgi:transcription elongation GreA/GreB family factor